MIKIEIKSLPPSEIVKDIANHFGVSYDKEGNEYNVEVPGEWGTGKIAAIQFDEGFGLLLYDCMFHEDVEIHFVDEYVHPLKFMYCLDGHIQIRLDDQEEFVIMEKYHNAILASKGENDHVFCFQGGKEVKLRNIEITKEIFQRRFASGDHGEASQIQGLFEDDHADDAFYYDGMYSVTLSHLFKKIDRYPHDGIMRTVFLEAVALEILSEQLSLYKADLDGENNQWRLREYELSCIGNASRIIEEELEDICTIPELAYRTGLNVNKLQEGFKVLYNMTVNEYIHEIRMKRAHHLLRFSSYNISEIVVKVGLNSKSYFSKIFKDAYGITPTEYRKNKFKRVELKSEEPTSSW